MTILEAIEKRRSVRTFDGAPLRGDDAMRILEFAQKTENPFGLPIEWMLLGAARDGLSAPVITGADTYIAGKLRRGPRAEEAFGYAFERIVLYAQTLGIGTTWIAGTMDRPAFERAIGLSEGEVMPCVSPLGYPAARMSVRETMMRKGVRANSRLPFEELFFDGTFDSPLTPERAGALRTMLEAVRLAPSAVNRQPWRVAVCSGTAHFYEKRSRGMADGGWDIQRIDMGIALCHFALAAEACGLPLRMTTEDPRIPGAEGLEYVASWVSQQGAD